MRETKALVFDCDGTLLDTRLDYLKAINVTLKAFGLPPITMAEGASFLGFGSVHFVKAAMKGQREDEFPEVFNTYLDYYLKHVYVKTAKYPGVDEMLKTAKALGYSLFVASNKPDQALRELFKKAFPPLTFNDVFGQIGGTAPKPDPYLLTRIMATNHYSPDEIAYFGDTEVDYRFARNAEVDKVYIVTYGFRSEAFLKANTAPRGFLQSVAELAKLISRLP